MQFFSSRSTVDNTIKTCITIVQNSKESKDNTPVKQISSKPGPTADNTTEPTVARGHDSDNKAVESVESTPTIPSNFTWDSGYEFSIGNEAANDIDSDANSVLVFLTSLLKIK